MQLLLASAVGGLLVAASTEVARRSKSTWGGFLAAAPITPTLAILDGPGQDAARAIEGLPVIFAATLCLAVTLSWQRRQVSVSPALALLVGVPPIAWAVRGLPAFLALAAIVAVVALQMRRPATPAAAAAARQRLRLGFVPRGIVGALMIAGVLWASRAMPLLSPLLSLYPSLLLVSLLVAQWGGGVATTASLARFGLAAGVAVSAFVIVVTLIGGNGNPDPLALVFGWLAFILVAALWRVGPDPQRAVESQA